MKFKSFHTPFVLHIFSLLLTMFFFFLSLFKIKIILLTVLLFLLIIYQALRLYKNVSKMNTVFISFLEAIKYEDYTFSVGKKKNGFYFEELNHAFRDITDKIKINRLEKEKNYQHLQTIIKHIHTGLFSYDSDGRVNLLNQAAKKILNINRLRHLDDLNSKSKELSSFLKTIEPGTPAVLKLLIDDQWVNLSLFSTKYVLMGKNYSLISIQNIRKELEEKEIEAWQKLISVLTHEILNSMAPITSLASSALRLFPDNPTHSPSSDDLSDINKALQTIANRSEGLMNFVNSYRRMSRLPELHTEKLLLKDILTNIEKLLSSGFLEKGIFYNWSVLPENLEIIADSEQLDQLLINILKNAAESKSETSSIKIELQAKINIRSRVCIHIKDNGDGISSENLEKIFIPFFSAKEGGSGIGLSLSQQIMRAHGGNISVDSNLGQGSKFTLEF